MGKVRIKTLGIEEVEEKQGSEARSRSARKKEEKKRTVKAPGQKGGERVVAVGPSEEELAKLLEEEQPQPASPQGGSPESPQQPQQPKPAKQVKKPARSKRYSLIARSVDRTKTYPLTEALTMLPKLKLSQFDETVELHVNTSELGVAGTVTLPHGTGKKTRVAVANDALIADVEQGKIGFDVLIATPDMMPKLARVAKFLGPRGLMPNPKRGTVSEKPEELAKKYEEGHVAFRTESKAPIIHLTVGKLSFGQEKLSENIRTMLSAIPQSKIKSVTLKSTMSPGIRIELIRS